MFSAVEKLRCLLAGKGKLNVKANIGLSVVTVDVGMRESYVFLLKSV